MISTNDYPKYSIKSYFVSKNFYYQKSVDMDSSHIF